jgi:hypothetical protein
MTLPNFRQSSQNNREAAAWEINVEVALPEEADVNEITMEQSW